MVSYCIVPSCRIRATTNKGKGKKVSFFTTPKELDRREKWRKALELLKLQSHDLVCEKHFPEDVIIRSKRFYDDSLNLIAEIPFKVPRLEKNAIPILNGECQNGNKENNLENYQDGITQDYVNVDIVMHDHDYTIASDSSQKNVEVIENKMSTVFLNCDEIGVNCEVVINEEAGEYCGIIEETDNFGISFVKLCAGASTINLPKNWVFHYFENYLTFCELCIKKDSGESSSTFVRKCINIDNTLGISYSISGKKISQETWSEDKKIDNLKDLEERIVKFSSMDMCCGVTVSSVKNIKFVKSEFYYRDIFGAIRHANCSLLSTSTRCNMCSKLLNTMYVNTRRNKKSNATRKVNMLKKKLRAKIASLKHVKLQLQALKKSTDRMKSDLAKVDLKDILVKCAKNNLSDIQVTLVKQIVLSAKYGNTKSCRYNEDWIMMCLLLYTRSPKEYNFMKNLNLLPLPSVRTIRRYLSAFGNKLQTNFIQPDLLHYYNTNKKKV